MDLCTIGYEGVTQAEVIARLQAARVETLVDVRAIAASRRAGFSKTLLRESLAEAGIDYLHLRGLGTPKAGREAARKGRIAQMHDIFNAHMAEPAAVVDFATLGDLAVRSRVALLCFEAQACGCHRLVLADRLRLERGVDVKHL
ncbi:MAG: DUF488 domain-containing protein [Brevundimonas sp.]|nr:DUF488 domain-containing protein [Brevundimonas sp.]